MRTRSTKFNIRRLTVFLIAGTAAVVAVCLGAVLWVLAVSASSVDRAAEDGARKLVDSIVDTYLTNLSKSIVDYATWDDVYDRMSGTRSAAWENENIGRSITRNFNTDFVAITARDGSILYWYDSEGDVPSLAAQDIATLQRLTRLAVNAKPRTTGAAVSGVVPFEGTVSLVAASPIFSTKMPDRGGRRFVLIEMRDLRPGFLAKLGRDFGVEGLRAVRAHAPGLPLIGPDGKQTEFSLAWTPSGAGKHLFTSVLPAVLAMGLVLLLVLAAFLVFWWRVIEHIRTNEARVLEAEIGEAHARAVSAEEMAKSKSAFIANMSHELRTPLNAIIGFSEIIESQVFGPIGAPKYREYVTAINESGHHLLRIINDILLVSKVEAGKFAPHIEDFSCGEVISDTLRMMEVLAGKRGIRLDASKCACDVTVTADKQALRQILVNILSNAVKFSPDGASIEIESDCADGGNLVLRVADHGPGIPPATLKEIGKPFVQAESVYTRNFQGTGLGLAICFRLAAAMDAGIHIASEVGSGTTVTVTVKTPQSAMSEPAQVA